MKHNLKLTDTELNLVLVALNVEKERQMRDGSPEYRKLASELRDRVAKMIAGTAQ